MHTHLTEKIDLLPESPGVYLMRDEQGSVFYIGKAVSLRTRVKQYFNQQDMRFFVQKIPALLHDIEVVLTHNEKEALLLENELIKKHKPKFNIKLTDDSNYVCLRINTNHPYPKIDITRKIQQDGCVYFGPFHQAGSLRKTLTIINRYFQLRTCTDSVLNNRSYPCLQYQIKRCLAPCVYDLPQGAYAENVRNVIDFLSGNTDHLISHLQQKMRERSLALDFEHAAKIRDHMHAIEKSLQKQHMISNDASDRDFIGIHTEQHASDICVLQYRKGRLNGTVFYTFKTHDITHAEETASFLCNYYTQRASVPDVVYLDAENTWTKALAQHLSETAGKKVRIESPKEGSFKEILSLSTHNAVQQKEKRVSLEARMEEGLKHIQEMLHLKKKPCTIDCIDISHHQGQLIVASAVRFKNGFPYKKGYKRFRIKSLENQNDFQSIYETTLRHIKRLLPTHDLPDLLLIDGGKGQLQAAYSALHELKCTHIDLASVAKARTSKNTEERVFTVGSKEPVVLKEASVAYKIICGARDEAHRFALSYQKNLRNKQFLA